MTAQGPADRPQGPVEAVIGIGTNVGDRLATIEAAIETLDDSTGIAVRDVSGIYETAPWGGVEQEPYFNAVAAVMTGLSPRELLAELQLTEQAFGRDRTVEQRWGPRTLDLDILLYGDLQLTTPELTVPHPHLAERPFVLVPLLEVKPGCTLPDGRRVSRLLNDLAPIDGVELVVRLPR